MKLPTRGNRELMRAINRAAVLNTIRERGDISRTEVAALTGLSPATITTITAELIEEGLVFEKTSGDSRGGRRPILLALNPHGGYVVGIKLTEEHVFGALTDLEATVLAKMTGEMENPRLDTAVNAVVRVVNALVERAAISREKLLGVGVGLAGIVDAGEGVLRHSPIFGWQNVPLAGLLRSHLHVPVYIDNDVNTLTLTEQLFGAGRGIENFLTMTIGRGVGMGVVLNGQLYRGRHGGAGEIGHTVLDPEGPRCACGNRGCLETYVSDPHLLRMAGEAFARGELQTEISTVEELLQLARGGNPVARAIYAQAGEKLGRTIANLINALNPSLIIISGEGMRAADFIVDSLHAAIERHVMPGLAGDAEVRIDLMSDDAWARGAASLVLQELFKTPFFRTASASSR
ncbi:MAG: ROK family transcriptional regulator [Chloroflexi bacterium]|nr:ROK family transcriptional regulator [Chloroflexota bacterium]